MGSPIGSAALRVEEGSGNRFFSSIDDGSRVRQSVHLRRGRMELRALGAISCFRLVQLEKLETNLEARKRNFARLSEYFCRRPDVFALPRTTPGLDTAWHMFPVLDTPRIRYPALRVPTPHGIQRCGHSDGVDRQRDPAAGFRKVPHRVPLGGLPERRPSDGTRSRPALQPRLDDDDIDYIWAMTEEFLS